MSGRAYTQVFVFIGILAASWVLRRRSIPRSREDWREVVDYVTS